MTSEMFLKLLNKKIADIKVINIKDDPSYNLSIRLISKAFFDKCIRNKKSVIEYVREYNFSAVIGEGGMPRTDETAIKNSIDFCYFLIFAADKYGAAFVLEKLLKESVVHEKYSKLNPINWLKWIFNKIVWSEIKANPGSMSDENFCKAIKGFQTYKLDSTTKLFDNEELYKDLTIIIKKIAVANPLPPMLGPNGAPPAPAMPIVGPNGVLLPPPPPPPMPGTNGAPPAPPALGLLEAINKADLKLTHVDKNKESDKGKKPIDPAQANQVNLATEAKEVADAMRKRRKAASLGGERSSPVSDTSKVEATPNPSPLTGSSSMFPPIPVTSDSQPPQSGATPTPPAP